MALQRQANPSTVFSLNLPELASLVGCSESRLVLEFCGDVVLSTSPRTSRDGSPRGRSRTDSYSGPVTVALITAARRRAVPAPIHPKELLQLGECSVIVHSLRALAASGVRTVVVLVAAGGAEIIAHVSAQRGGLVPTALVIEWIDLGEGWAGCHAQSILRARGRIAELCEPAGGA